jgi:HEAT repeat protein
MPVSGHRWPRFCIYLIWAGVPEGNFTPFQVVPKLYSMDGDRQKSPAEDGISDAPSLDPRPQPSPDYGTLGPTPDVANLASPSSVSPTPIPSAPGRSASGRPPSLNLRLLHFVAPLLGAAVALLVSSGGGPGALWGKITGPLSPQTNSSLSSGVLSDHDLDRQRPQKQAEMLLERAVSRSDSTANQGRDGDRDKEQDKAQVAAQAEAQIAARINAWRGKLKWDAQLGELTTVALNSDDQSLRASAIEVQLSAYGLNKSESSVDALVRRANSSDHAQKIWALWTLGLLGNRGVETVRVVEVLTAHLKDSAKSSGKDQDEDVRRWAVEGLALVGTTSTIVPLLDAMHNDPSPMVRERAACSLAESGMLTHEQRLAAVPQLINYSDDPALDAQTHAWAFQALADITRQRLPNDSAAWRNWYQTSVVGGQ